MRLQRMRDGAIFSSDFNAIAPSSPLHKNIPLLAEPKISTTTPAVLIPQRGAYRDRHGRWDGMRWTRQRRARTRLQGGSFGLVSDKRRDRRTALMRR